VLPSTPVPELSSSLLPQPLFHSFSLFVQLSPVVVAELVLVSFCAIRSMCQLFPRRGRRLGLFRFA
jgi:hypothetical protein